MSDHDVSTIKNSNMLPVFQSGNVSVFKSIKSHFPPQICHSYLISKSLAYIPDKATFVGHSFSASMCP